MKTIREDVVPPNSGWHGHVDKGQVLRISAKSVIDVVAYNRADTKEYFDVARTRVYNLNIYPTRGHRLFSKQNNPMMRWLADGFRGIGLHDLQCPHGCPELMIETLRPMQVAATELPELPPHEEGPVPGHRHGLIRMAPAGPDRPVAVDLEAEIDLILALVNCPDPATSARGANATVSVVQP